MKPTRDLMFKIPTSFEEMPFGAGYPSGHLVSTNAGYRTFSPEFDYEKCIHCLLCFVFCPEGAICKDEEKLTIDMDYCKGCGICANECPRKCIKMVREEERK